MNQTSVVVDTEEVVLHSALQYLGRLKCNCGCTVLETAELFWQRRHQEHMAWFVCPVLLKPYLAEGREGSTLRVM